MELIKQNLFETPETSRELEEYIESFPEDQRAALYSVAGKTWNLACKTVEVANELQKKKRKPNTSEEMLCLSHGYTVKADGSVHSRNRLSDNPKTWESAEQCISDMRLR